MEEQIFCDGIGRIAVIGGVVRLDLFTYSPSETDANGNPRPVLSHRIVMGTEGFLHSPEKVIEAVQAIQRARQTPSRQSPPQPAQSRAQGQPLAASPPVQPVPPSPQPTAKPPQSPPTKPPFP